MRIFVQIEPLKIKESLKKQVEFIKYWNRKNPTKIKFFPLLI